VKRATVSRAELELIKINQYDIMITKRTRSKIEAFDQTQINGEVVCLNPAFVTHGNCPATQICDPGPAAVARIHEIEAARVFAESTPEFLAATSLCLESAKTLGTQHPDTTRALMLAIALGPPCMHDFVAGQAHEMDLMPKAYGYTKVGKPVFSLKSVAAKLGIDMVDATKAMQAMLTARKELGLFDAPIDPATIHVRH